MRVLVAGGSGYIGTRLTEYLLENDHKVRCVDIRSPSINKRLLHSRESKLEYLCTDIRDACAVKHAMRGIDAVVHLAAVVGYPACAADPQRAVSTNVIGTKILLDALPVGVNFVFNSSCSVYGNVLSDTIDETHTPNPLTLYGRTKLEAEHAVKKRGGIVLRPVTAYGPSRCFRPELLPHDFIGHGLRGDIIQLFQPNAVRPLIHIEDICRAIVFCLNNSVDMAGDTYNLCSLTDGSVTKYELACLIAAITGLVIEADEDSSDPDGRDYKINARKLHKLGFKTIRSLKEGLQETVEWMRNFPIEPGNRQ